MKSKAFAQIKEAIGANRSSAMQAVASAQVCDLSLARNPKSGRSGEDAARRAAMVSLGKKSILYRFGNAQNERSGAIEDLVEILKADERGFAHPWTEVIAGTALHELAFDKCASCFGRGEVPDHSVEELTGRQPMRVCDTCQGEKRHRYREDERTSVMAREFVFATKIRHESERERQEAITETAKVMRKNTKLLRDMQHAVDYAKQVLIDAERASVEGAGMALERMRPE